MPIHKAPLPAQLKGLSPSSNVNFSRQLPGNVIVSASTEARLLSWKKPCYEHRMKEKRFGLSLILTVTAVFIWSYFGPCDTFTWFLEVLPALLGGVALAWTYRRFKLTRMTYFLLAIHAIILMVGGRYTYALNPLFEWLKEALNLSRNYYDRLGHFAQGFIPAVLVREVLLRATPLRRGGWLFFLVTSVCLAVSAFYEFIEWWVAVATGDAADDFLGTQGDVWDTQWDMFLCMVGAIVSQLFLGRFHDRALSSRQVE